jgi:hypothetical protein
MNVSTFSSLVGGLLLTFSLVTILTLQTGTQHGTAKATLTSLTVLAVLSLLAGAWFIHGLRLRHRLAELVGVAAIRAGLQPLGKSKGSGK